MHNKFFSLGELMFFKSKKTTPQNIFDAVELQDLDYIASIAKEKNFDIDQHCTEDKGLLATATALGLAAARGHYDVCVLLIELGADVNFEGLDGRLTPLDFAAENGHLPILVWARENGCKWDRKDCINRASNYPHIIDWIKSQKVE